MPYSWHRDWHPSYFLYIILLIIGNYRYIIDSNNNILKMNYKDFVSGGSISTTEILLDFIPTKLLSFEEICFFWIRREVRLFVLL